jgi:hypothetical protein
MMKGSWTKSELSLSIHLTSHLTPYKEMGASNKTATTTTKLLKLWPYRTIVVCSLYSHDSVVRLNFCNWYFHQSMGILKKLSLLNQSTHSRNHRKHSSRNVLYILRTTIKCMNKNLFRCGECIRANVKHR